MPLRVIGTVAVSERWLSFAAKTTSCATISSPWARWWWAAEAEEAADDDDLDEGGVASGATMSRPVDAALHPGMVVPDASVPDGGRLAPPPDADGPAPTLAWAAMTEGEQQ